MAGQGAQPAAQAQKMVQLKSAKAMSSSSLQQATQAAKQIRQVSDKVTAVSRLIGKG
jgi:thioredoxin-like negative regulator of GroEL